MFGQSRRESGHALIWKAAAFVSIAATQEKSVGFKYTYVYIHMSRARGEHHQKQLIKKKSLVTKTFCI